MSNKNRKISLCFFSGNRADYGPLEPVIVEAANRSEFDVSLIIAKAHAKAAENINACCREIINIADTGKDSEQALNTASYVISEVGRMLQDVKPDWFVILGDRFEALSAAQAAVMLNIPIVHLCGGDLSYGSFDEYFRHAITKMSHIHFVTNNNAAKRVIKMGETPGTVFVVGHPGIDNTKKFTLVEKETLFAELGLSVDKKTAMVCFHPVTGALDMGEKEFHELLSALKESTSDLQFLITGANTDPYGDVINNVWEELASQYEDVHYVHTLGTERFWPALNNIDIFIGNSSAIIYEAPVVGVHAINVGTRQKGRDKPAVVNTVEAKKDAIHNIIIQLLKQPKPKPDLSFGDGHAAEKICNILSDMGVITSEIKEFYA